MRTMCWRGSGASSPLHNCAARARARRQSRGFRPQKPQCSVLQWTRAESRGAPAASAWSLSSHASQMFGAPTV